MSILAKVVDQLPAPKAPEGAKLVGTMKAIELYRLLSDTVMFTGRDDTLPMLTAVHIECDGKNLIACATDRFTFGIGKLSLDRGGMTCEFNLLRHHVAMLLKLTKTANRSEKVWRQVAIGVKPDGSVVFNFTTDEQLSFKPYEGQFPNWRHLVPDSGTEVARATTALNPEYLARFAKVSSSGYDRCMKVFTFDAKQDGNRRPVAVTIGDDFIGLIMPMRLPDDGHTFRRPEWVA